MNDEPKKYTESEFQWAQEFLAFTWRCRVAELEQKIVEMCRQLTGERKE